MINTSAFFKLVCTSVSLVCGLTLILLLGRPAAGQATAFWMPPGFVQDTVVSGLKLPTAFAFAPGGRVYIAQKGGVVRVFANGALLPEPFIDLSGEVNEAADRGLLGIAVHPNFPATPYIYLGYVYDPPEAKGYFASGARVSRVLRISADPNNLDRAVPGSGVVLVGANGVFATIGNPGKGDAQPFTCQDSAGNYVQDCLPEEGTAHSVGQLAFGRDGALYVASGDGINYGPGSLRAQALDSLAGKILRINPINGAGYPNNPFYDGNPNSNRSKVYLLGMKNPFRFAIHPTSGELWVADVGNLAWEEITRAGAGANLGWPCFEGPKQNAFDPVCQPLLNGVQPVSQGIYTYPHKDGWGAVIGGDFYTGKSYPTIFRNAYFFGDFNKGFVQVMTFDRAGVPTVSDFASNVPGLVQLSSGPDGNLYILSIANGALYRIRYEGDGSNPTNIGVTATPANNQPTAATPVAGGNPGQGAGKPAQPAGAGTGKILREWWFGIGGNTVDDLTKSSRYGGKPDGREFLTSLNAPRLFGKDYGTRLRGYIHPPVSGDYRFWIAADDSAQLWLSSDANPANKRLIASAPAWTRAEEWDRYPEQQSQVVPLQAGQKYYIEALHKQGDQKDNLSIAWQIPGGERQIVEGSYLSPVSAE